MYDEKKLKKLKKAMKVLDKDVDMLFAKLARQEDEIVELRTQV